jgi:hypothetical protein
MPPETDEGTHGVIEAHGLTTLLTEPWLGGSIVCAGPSFRAQCQDKSLVKPGQSREY